MKLATVLMMLIFGATQQFGQTSLLSPPKTIVVIMDSGIDVHHPELMNQVWSNPNEQLGNNKDDDGDGCIDDIIGCNVFNSTDDVDDMKGHGTYVASVLSGKSNLTAKLAALLTEPVRYYPIKFLTAVQYNEIKKGKIMATYFNSLEVSGSIETAVKAIDVAIALHKTTGSNVIINGSWTFNEKQEDIDKLIQAMERAQQAGLLMVMAAGNRGEESNLAFPASIGGSNLISVGATLGGKFAFYSCKGADIATDGTILPNLGKGYASYLRGTSFATPVVVMAAFQIWTTHPSWTPAQVKARILETADKVDFLDGKVQEKRLLNFEKAIAN